jgi:hypothetical protein
MPLSVAQRIFASEDDLHFDAPDTGERPRQLFQYSSGAIQAWPFRAPEGAATAGFALCRSSAGEYSWLTLITPARSERNAFSDAGQLYTVAVVVFHKRVLREPNPDGAESGERVAIVREAVMGTGMGGGHLKLGPPAGVPQVYRPLGEGDWLLLCGQEPAATRNGKSPPVPVFVWYKVTAAGRSDSVTGQQKVSVSGPDWPLANAAQPPLQAVLLDRVVGVYTTTLQLDLSAVWAR